MSIPSQPAARPVEQNLADLEIHSCRWPRRTESSSQRYYCARLIPPHPMAEHLRATAQSPGCHQWPTGATIRLPPSLPSSFRVDVLVSPWLKPAGVCPRSQLTIFSCSSAQSVPARSHLFPGPRFSYLLSQSYSTASPCRLHTRASPVSPSTLRSHPSSLLARTHRPSSTVLPQLLRGLSPRTRRRTHGNSASKLSRPRSASERADSVGGLGLHRMANGWRLAIPARH